MPTKDDREKAKALVVKWNIWPADGFVAALAEALASERAAAVEACAKVCDDMSGWRDWAELKHPNFPGAPTEAGAAADFLAVRIRALGGTDAR